MRPTQITDGQYVAVRREFILKVDGNRPILYSLDYINTQIYMLTILEGFTLSLLDGEKPFSEVRKMFCAVLPQTEPGLLSDTLWAVNERIKQSPSQTGIGKEGVLEFSDFPIEGAQSFDPRQFVISPGDYQARMSDIKNRFRLDTPINIYTIFTHRCFANCIYCYADRNKVREMPLERWREILQEMEQLGIYLCSPDNGDTFARKDGIDFLECLLEHNMHFLLSTKAYVSRGHVKRLIDAGFTNKIRGVIQRQVQLSIDAADEDVAKRILNVTHVRTQRNLETFENFLAFGIMPKIKAVVTGLNYDQPKPIVDLFYPRGARVFHFVRYRRSFHRHTDDLFVNAESLNVLSRQFDEIRNDYPDVRIVENLTLGRSGPSELTAERARMMWANRIGCGGGWSALGISADGKAFLCEQMKMSDPFYVGDASSQSIQEIWNSDKLLGFIYPTRDQFKGTVCHTCQQFEECMWEKGRCYRDAYFSYGSIYEPPPLCPKNDRPGLQPT